MITKILYGNPINTDAVVIQLPAEIVKIDKTTTKNIIKEQAKSIVWSCEHKIGKSEVLAASKSSEQEGIHFVYNMNKKDVVYGLGENVRGINKRGWVYKSNCADDFCHSEDKQSLYGAHNFIVIQGNEKIGLFFDYAGTITFDIGYTNMNELSIVTSDENFTMYVINGDSVLDIVKEFRGLVGRSYIPPKWGMGFGQCRWSYMNADEIREVAKGYRENHIPLDAIYLDIDYMEQYKDFTVDEKAFPKLPEFVEEMKEMGIRLVPIIDAGVKIQDGYDIYEEGVAGNYFCKDKDGKDFVAGVWPGRVHFPDFLNSDARTWFGKKYKILLDAGIEGFWNDMNEPAIFYSEEHLNEVMDKLDEYKGKNLDIQSFFEFKGMVADVSNHPDDYKRFYHNMDGEQIRHDKVHNLYGYMMTRSAGEAFEELEPDKRILMYSRSSCVGMHRYGGIWTGDNQSWWSHILLSIKQMPSLNMCGILYTGSDIGGFGGNTTEDLVLRWTEFGIFTPLMRNHAAMGTRKQEAYAFTQTDKFRNIIGLRYFFMPYLYSEFMRAATKNEMYVMPMSFLYPEDEMALQVEDQLFVGEGLMIAPVYTQNAAGRYVYLPEDMKMYRFRSQTDMDIVAMNAGHHYISVELDEVLVFIRPNFIIPCSTGGECMEQLDDKKVILLGNVLNQSSYTLYTDNGFEKDYENPDHYSNIEVVKKDSQFICQSEKLEIVKYLF